MSRVDGRRGLRGLVVLVASSLVALGVGASPSAAASGRCAPGTGVTVVVDYGPIGGGVVIGCDPDGAGKDADDVVRAAGFDLTYVNTQPGFVCRVDGRPTQDDGEDCGDVPPADAYWGLFWSDADPASWVYSSEGVGSLELPEGSSIGWRFQDGGARENPGAPPTPEKKSPAPQPSRSPSPQPSKPPKATSPTPTPSASVPSGTDGSSPSPEAEPDGPDAPDEEQAPGRAGNGKGAKGEKGSGKGPDKGSDGKGKGKSKGNKAKQDAADEDAEPVVEPSDSTTDAALEPASDEPLTDDGSSAVLTLVAGSAVLLLVGAAGVIAWRRRV